MRYLGEGLAGSNGVPLVVVDGGHEQKGRGEKWGAAQEAGR
jgi:hypothetical protein